MDDLVSIANGSSHFKSLICCNGESRVSVSVFEVFEDRLELHMIATDRAHQKQGAARALIIKMAQEFRGTPIVLDVAVDNAGAISFYRRLGLKETGRRKGFYSNGIDALTFQGTPTC